MMENLWCSDCNTWTMQYINERNIWISGKLINYTILKCSKCGKEVEG